MPPQPDQHDLLALLTDELRKQIPNLGDYITRRVLMLFLRRHGLSFASWAGPLFEFEQRGWITFRGETYTTTREGARAFASAALPTARSAKPRKNGPARKRAKH
jgi:hypothetical protein